ncbi:hypothetical protein PIROE2DRAFT_5618 [Piromyces sp. E2]|nr:hypothetical protein PIROE2DRAFT_5618 [Piromyces sp. E2]|eukprot:OUM67012.1 hypothetical protein PIROE2DRAFT_5618 [Piromyces sp. E2]
MTEIDLFGNNIDSALLKKIDKKIHNININNNDDDDREMSVYNIEYSKNQSNKIKKSSQKKSSKRNISNSNVKTNKENSLYDYKLNDTCSKSFDIDLNLDLSENRKKESKESKNDNKKNKSEKNFTETFKIDLDKSDSIDDFIKFLSSQENISIDDLLSFNIDFSNKADSFSSDKLNMKLDTRNILNNFDFSINDNYINSDISYNTNNSIDDDKNITYNQCNCQCNKNKDRYSYIRNNSKKDPFFENLKDMNINNYNNNNNNNNNESNKIYY